MSVTVPESLGWSPQPVIDWLFSEGRLLDDNSRFVLQLAHQLVACGAPIERLLLTIQTLNPEIAATSNTWISSTDSIVPFSAQHGTLKTDRYIGSPMQQLFETEKRVRQRLDQLPEGAHAAYTELADDGFTDYLALPIMFNWGLGSALILSTKCAQGFSGTDIENFRILRNYLSPIIEVYSLRHLSKSLMNTYLGKRTGEKVLSGMIQRGDADIIHAALWFSDLRDFTHLTETLPARQVLEMLNEYFEFVSAAVTARGGEILRFIGDAMLIVFPIDDDMCQRTACNAALDSAIDAQSTLASLNHRRRRHGEPEISFGVGLNVGEVVYGNVGAPDRLDFTVMGPAVNRTARLESLTKTLGCNILFSERFSELIDTPSSYLGMHEMKGIDGTQAVYAVCDS
ncbi:MAG: adenylate/guanylate cyclase domain-containing protein [Gammaproteobacteria bacterium]|jgi:adenylate cyclase|nr:adenylate/guanylate cyclase domain-containing protein [Gammaproteobacteria bacterium]